MKASKILTIAFIGLSCLFLTNDVSAQPPGGGAGGPGNPGGGQGDPPCFPPPCIPIDGGLSFLLVAGTIYGGKKVFDLNKDNREEK